MQLFSKFLTPTDCLKRLSIPQWVLAFLPDFHGGHAVELQVSCESRQWSIVCTIRKKGNYNKPVLSRGWRKFVVGNSLNVGDELTLHKEEEDETGSLRYRVEVKRATGTSKAIRRRNKIGKKKRILQVVSSTNQASEHQSGISVVGPSAKHVNVAVEEPEKKFKLFGSVLLVRGAPVVGAGETVDSKAYHHHSFEQFGLTIGGAELVNCNDEASLGADQYYSLKEEKAAATVFEHFGDGLSSTADGVFVHCSHDQATGKSYYRNEQGMDLELDKNLGPSISIRGKATVNLNLTLAPPRLSSMF